MDPQTIILGTHAAIAIINALREYQETRRVNREMSPQEEAEWDRFVNDQRSLPHWKPSGVLGKPTVEDDLRAVSSSTISRSSLIASQERVPAVSLVSKDTPVTPELPTEIIGDDGGRYVFLSHKPGGTVLYESVPPNSQYVFVPDYSWLKNPEIGRRPFMMALNR